MHHHNQHPGAGHPHSKGAPKGAVLRLVAWEVTRNCNLSCMHCRASATMGPYTGELETDACLNLLDEIARSEWGCGLFKNKEYA